MISRIYEQQLDAILFSVNQYLWDNLAAWQSRLNRIQETSESAAAAEYRKIVSVSPALQTLAFSDYLFTHWRFYSRPDFNGDTEFIRRIVTDTLEKNSGILERLEKYGIAKYSKIETFMLCDPGADVREKLMPYYLADDESGNNRLVYLLLDLERFINTVLAPKLEDIAGDQFMVGVFSTTRQQLIYQNAALHVDELKQTRALWLLPDYKLGIRLRGENIEELSRMVGNTGLSQL